MIFCVVIHVVSFSKKTEIKTKIKIKEFQNDCMQAQSTKYCSGKLVPAKIENTEEFHKIGEINE